MNGPVGRSRRAIARLAVAGLFLLVLAVPSGGRAASLPSGFQDTVVFSDIEEPTALRFASDGRVFVAEKSGRILVYDSLEDTIPTTFADLSPKVFAAADRGLLGFVLDPQFPARPYVYVLYTYDHQLGEAGGGPRWGDNCPSPPGSETNGCVVSGRLSRLTAEGDHAVGSEEVLVEDWCQQFPSHSVGDLQFDSSGALYASGGDGANYNAVDYGQFGFPQKNPCGDPPGGVGGIQLPPAAEGGALRSQDLLTPGDPTGLNGTVIRIDPDTGEGLPGNPLYGSSDPNARRIVGFGFRNPFRFTLSPVTHEVYVGNVGAEAYEEIDRFNATSGEAYNSGWPCIEGPEINPLYANEKLDICERLYDEPDASAQAFYYYDHYKGIAPEDPCPHSNGNALTGMTFYEGGSFPPSYDDALFFADAVRGCIYAMFPGEDGRPDPSTVTPFLSDAGLYPGIDLEVGPEGDLYYTSLYGPEYGPGAVHRISYFSGNQPPVARLGVDKQWGSPPLEVGFDAGGSTDADGDPLFYEWDLDGDGTFDPPTSASTATRTYADSKNHSVAVRVSDPGGASSIDRITVYPGDTPPAPEILEPSAAFEWSVGEPIDFAGKAIDNEDGALSSTSLDWSTRLFHCPVGCHAHPLQAFPALAAGSFPAPDHEYPSYIELKLTATDGRGLSASKTVRVYPQAVELTIATDPPGLSLSAGSKTGVGPFATTVIKGSSVLLSAPLEQELGGETYTWTGWSDGGDRIHSIAAAGAATYEASYSTPEIPEPEAPEPPKPPLPPVLTPSGPPLLSQAIVPQTFLGEHPAKRTGRSLARFTFSSNLPGAVFRCSLDGGPLRHCHSPRRYGRLAPEGHSFQVAAVDGSGNVDPTPASFRWRVLP